MPAKFYLIQTWILKTKSFQQCKLFEEYLFILTILHPETYFAFTYMFHTLFGCESNPTSRNPSVCQSKNEWTQKDLKGLIRTKLRKTGQVAFTASSFLSWLNCEYVNVCISRIALHFDMNVCRSVNRELCRYTWLKQF